ncbi:hypothetical protein GGR51DRAFT_558761 [Nemania sp. FL0031]|nr:hypothetical protein GGR51DRAFT_558761 [Nemania sp. FL0031]
MSPVVKVWIATLNDGHSVVETAFSGLWHEVMMAAASISGGDGHYGLFHCDQEPGLLAVILGYRSIEVSNLVQQKLGKIVTRLAEWVTHQELYLLDADVSEVPINSEKIAILLSESQPSDPESLPGKGEWGESVPSVLTSHLPIDPSQPKKMTWVQVAQAEDAGRLRELGTLRTFTKVMESHIATHDAD